MTSIEKVHAGKEDLIKSLTLATLGIVGVVLVWIGWTADTERAMASLQHRLKLLSQEPVIRIEAVVEQYLKDIHYLADLPPINGIIRASKNGFDEQEQTSLRLWLIRLEYIFSLHLRAHEGVSQVRFIGVANGGLELVRVERLGNRIIVRKQRELQKKAHRDYFQEVISRRSGETYISAITLNREYGRIDSKRAVTIRFAKPVYNAGQVFGFVVVNVRLDDLFNFLKKRLPEDFSLYITNAQDKFLVHPDHNYEFSFEFGDNHSWHQELQKIDVYSHTSTFFLESGEERLRHSVIVTVPKSLIYSVVAESFWYHFWLVLVGLVIIYLLIVFYKDSRLRLRQASQAKKLAELSNKAKSDFLANMTHEIRTPMNAVLGTLQILRKRSLVPEDQKDIECAEAAAQGLLSILNDILDYSKIESGKLTLVEEDVKIDNVLSNTAAVVSSIMSNRSLRVLFDIDTKMPCVIRMDSLRFQQILVNLLSNAVKFTEQGSVCLKIKNYCLSGDLWELFVSVRDTGIGMTQDQIERVFDSFEQAESSTSRRFGGTGLGLSITRRLTSMMGAKLDVESVPGEGSHFFFSIPIKVIDKRTSVELLKEQIGNMDLKILVVDSNVDSRMLLSRIILTFGWDVTSAASSIDAMNLLNSKKFDIVFFEGHGDNRSRFMQHVKHINPASKMKFVIITNFAEQLKHLDNNGINDMVVASLREPITASAFLKATKLVMNVPEPNLSSSINKPQLSHRLSSLNLLLVEDNKLNQRIAQHLLKGEGASVTIANNGVECLNVLRESKSTFDLVLMDIQMPELDGYETTKIIRSDPKLSGIPIIAMTANATRSDREACMEVGMNEHIGKPFQLNDLVQKILTYKIGDIGGNK